MKAKTILSGVILIGNCFLLGSTALACEPPCPGCQIRNANGICEDDDSRCEHYCYGAECVECEDDHSQCLYCEYCSSQTCRLMLVNNIFIDPGSGILCNGSTGWFYADTTPGGSYNCRLTWEHEGAVDSYSNCGLSWAEWTTPGTYTVTAGCGEAGKSVVVTVIGVESVEASEVAVCYPDSIIFTANPTPSGPLNGLQWSCRYREGTEDEWSNWSSFYGDGDATLELDPGAWMGPGFYQVRARNGSNDIWCDPNEVKVVQVNLEPQAHSPLTVGQICSNAQAEYRRSPWKATVIPGGTTATVGATGAAVIGEGSLMVTDDEIFYVNSIDEATVGPYRVVITHNDCSDCPQESEEYDVFKFWNTELTAGTTTRPEMPQGGAIADLEGKSVKADNPVNGGAIKYAVIHTPYYFKILTEPTDIFSGSVKAIVAAEVSANGFIKIKKLAPPPEPVSNSLSLSYMFLNVTRSWQTGGDTPYGAALADTDSKVMFLEWSSEHKDFYKTHEDVPDPSWGQWGEKIWSTILKHGLETPSPIKPLLNVGTNYHIDWQIAVGSAVGEHDSVQITINRRFQTNINYEVREYEIPEPE